MTGSTARSTATGGSTAEQMKDEARDKAQAVQEKASGTLGQARGRLREQVDQRSTDASERIHATAQDVRSVAEELRRQGKDVPARLADQVANRVESFGSYLRDADGERLLGDMERFARRQPWAIAAGGLSLGFAASRFLKASSSRRYWSGDGDRARSSARGRTDGGQATRFTSGSDAADIESGYGNQRPRGRAEGTSAVVDGMREPAPEAARQPTMPVDDQYSATRNPKR